MPSGCAARRGRAVRLLHRQPRGAGGRRRARARRARRRPGRERRRRGPALRLDRGARRLARRAHRRRHRPAPADGSRARRLPAGPRRDRRRAVAAARHDRAAGHVAELRARPSRARRPPPRAARPRSLPAGASPNAAVAAAIADGAAAVLRLRAGAPGRASLTDGSAFPSSACPRPRLERSRRVAAAVHVGVAIGTATAEPNAAADASHRSPRAGSPSAAALEPQLTAPGVGIETSDPGRGGRRRARLRTVTGTSVCGRGRRGRRRAARPGPARPRPRPTLASLLAGSAHPSGAPVDGRRGALDLGASAAGEVAASTTSLGFGPWNGPRWHQTTHGRPPQRLDPPPCTDDLAASSTPRSRSSPRTSTLRPAPRRRSGHRDAPPRGRRCRRQRHGRRRAPRRPGAAAALGDRLPAAYTAALSARCASTPQSFMPSDSKPASCKSSPGGSPGAESSRSSPSRRLDLLLYNAGGTYLGLLARAPRPAPRYLQLRYHRPRPDRRAARARALRDHGSSPGPLPGGAVRRARIAFRIE